MRQANRNHKGRMGRNRVSYACTGLKIRGILEPMPPVESESQAARRQLDRVLASPGFARNERLSRFLRFVVERHLEGRDQELKESLIAIEVFGRPPGHDSKQDPIVRTEASRLRAPKATSRSRSHVQTSPAPVQVSCIRLFRHRD